MPRLKGRIRLFVVVVLALLSFVLGVDSHILQDDPPKNKHVTRTKNQAKKRDSRSHRVIEVIDGDTIYLDNSDRPLKIRLIGIDAPEARENEKALRDSQRSGKSIKVITELGNKSAQYLRSLLKNAEVTLEFDVEKFDRFGRTLAYVYTESGELVNLKLVKEGYVYPYSVPPNLRYAEEFKNAARIARKQKQGLWSNPNF